MHVLNPHSCLVRGDAAELLGAAAAAHRQPGGVGHLPVGQDAVGEPHALLLAGTTWGEGGSEFSFGGRVGGTQVISAKERPYRRGWGV